MGAKNRAQRRGKAAKGSQKGTPLSQRKLNSSMHVPDLSPSTRSNALMGWQDSFQASSPAGGYRNMTMGDAARNTERHVSGWGATKLRGQAISFVSAGLLHQDPEHIRAQDDAPADDLPQKSEPLGSNETESDGREILEETEVDDPAAEEPIPERQVPVTKVEPETLRHRSESSSSSSSSSDAEHIVFTGRSKGQTPNTASHTASNINSRAQSKVRSLPVKEGSATPTTSSSNILTTKAIPIAQQTVAQSGGEASSSDRRIFNPRHHGRGRGKGRGRRSNVDIDEEEAIMRDYIANMAMDDTEESEVQLQQSPAQQVLSHTKARKNETFRFYEGSGEENMKVQLQSTRKTRLNREFEQAMDWNSDDLQDFDDLSTTDEEVDEISQVLRDRERESGIQYLVTPIGLGAGHAKWILSEKLVSKSAQNEIAIFREIQAMEFDEESIDEENEDVDQDDPDETTDEELEEALNDLIEHIESEDDENARIMKHTSKMSDEQIARALAKQEELGMGGDELMLFSGDLDGDVNDPRDLHGNNAFSGNADFIPFSVKDHISSRTRSKRNKKVRDSFPSATAFADALDQDPYGGFDVMEWDRPSLRANNKGRKSGFPYDLELEDDDLRHQLVTTWTKDRDKKAQRKREKEEARLSALLEFADRSEPSAIKAEIRRFLVQDIDVLRLPPMESAVRASVHRLAKALQLNSRSEGKDGTDKGRYPVLTKTHRTPSYTIDTVWEIDALLNTRKFFPKGSYKREKLPRGTARATRTRNAGGIQGASYMNGEVVGASAPEIGADNKGRAMLEKMGWSSGMAIGAEGNKGSLEAVKHIFKTSRAGLG